MEIVDSILNSVKKMHGLDPGIDSFDPDLIININSAIGILTQLGVGPSDGYYIHDESETFDDFLGDKITQKNMVKQYLYIKTRLVFDASTMSGSLLDAMKKQAEELEWRLNAQVESIDKGG